MIRLCPLAFAGLAKPISQDWRKPFAEPVNQAAFRILATTGGSMSP